MHFWPTLAVPAALAASAAAHITGMKVTVDPVTTAQNPTFSVTFTTTATAEAVYDASAVFGIRSALILPPITPATIGVPFANIDLVALGKSVTGNGTFTAKLTLDRNVLTTTTPPTTNGAYIITSAITSARGALGLVELEFLSQGVSIK